MRAHISNKFEGKIVLNKRTGSTLLSSYFQHFQRAAGIHYAILAFWRRRKYYKLFLEITYFSEENGFSFGIGE